MTHLNFSYSFLDAYEQCPEKSRRLFVTRDVKRAWMAEKDGGVDAHAALEKRLTEQAPLPPALAHAESFVQSFERLGAVEAEVLLGVDAQIRPQSTWSAWFRGKFDVLVRKGSKAVLGDWKTGKTRESDKQLAIGALLLFENDPGIDHVVGMNIWLKAGQVGQKYEWSREGKGATWAPILKKTREIEGRDYRQEWEKRPSGLCPYCPVSSCEHYRGG